MVHSLSHPLGGLTEKRPHHGTLNAIFLPHVLRFNMEACRDKLDRMARALHVGTAEQLPEAFEAVNAAIVIPSRLRDINLTRDDLEGMAELALEDHCSSTNPRKITWRIAGSSIKTRSSGGAWTHRFPARPSSVCRRRVPPGTHPRRR